MKCVLVLLVVACAGTPQRPAVPADPVAVTTAPGEAAPVVAPVKLAPDDVVDDNADWAGQRKTKLVRFAAQKL